MSAQNTNQDWRDRFDEKFDFLGLDNQRSFGEYSNRDILKEFIENERRLAQEEVIEKIRAIQQKYRKIDKRTGEEEYTGGGECRNCGKRRDSLEIRDIIALTNNKE